jgi:hypothetical protein
MFFSDLCKHQDQQQWQNWKKGFKMFEDNRLITYPSETGQFSFEDPGDGDFMQGDFWFASFNGRV